jgi:hypothetical protein
MKILLICLLSVNVLLTNGKQPDWFNGVLVTDEQQVFTGPISVDLYKGIVLLKNKNGTADVFTAHHIRSLLYYDAQLDVVRKFVSVPSRGRQGLKLFEVVLAGKISVFRSQRLPTITEETSEDAYVYFSYYNDEILPLRKFATAVFPKVESNQLNVFIRQNDLTLFFQSDAIRIIQFFNASSGKGKTLFSQR